MVVVGRRGVMYVYGVHSRAVVFVELVKETFGDVESYNL